MFVNKSITNVLIAWDFDGVLNRNIRDGRFFWADDLEADLGISLEGFQKHMFGPDRIRQIVRGQLDLREELAGFLAATGSAQSADAVMDYWFEKDMHLDAQVLGWLRAAKARCVLATNNEAHRTRYIAETMGLGAEVEHIFASGPMGVAKPDDGFFEMIEAWSGEPRAQILLIDDTAKNIDAAAARGWQGFHFTDATRDALPAVLGLAG